MPNDAELRRTGISFNRAFTATAMCSPSRASFLTGTYPSRHGVTLTLTEGDLFPDQRNLPDVLRTVARLAPQRRGPAQAPGQPLRCAGCCASARRAAASRSCRRASTRSRRMLRERGYHVALKGKWHLTQARQRARVDRRRPRAHRARLRLRRLGAAGRRRRRQGRDTSAAATPARRTRAGTSDYTRQVERWLARQDLPEPFCLVVSLVNPHDVLGYPSSVRGRRLHALAVPRPRRARCRRPSTRTCATSRPCTR